MIEVERRTRRTDNAIVGRPFMTELRGVRLTDDDRPCLFEALDVGG